MNRTELLLAPKVANDLGVPSPTKKTNPVLGHAFISSKLVISLVSKDSAMQTWPVQDAKARFSELLDTCIAEGPQLVTKRGVEAAVLVPVHAWHQLQAAARPSIKELLLSDEARGALALPARGAARRRTVVAWEPN